MTTKNTSEQPSYSAQAEAMKQQFFAGLANDVSQQVGVAMAKLLASDAGNDAPRNGQKAQDFTLPNALGETIRLYDTLANGPVVLSFYRGGWCPFCNLEFKALQDRLPEMKELGASLIGISPELPNVTRETAKKFKLQFDVLSDVGNQVARQYGLIMTVFEEIRPIYKQWGIDVVTANGDDSYELPLPATFVIANNGNIQASYINKDYTQRMEPADIVAALRQMQ